MTLYRFVFDCVDLPPCTVMVGFVRSESSVRPCVSDEVVINIFFNGVVLESIGLGGTNICSDVRDPNDAYQWYEEGPMRGNLTVRKFLMSEIFSLGIGRFKGRRVVSLEEERTSWGLHIFCQDAVKPHSHGCFRLAPHCCGGFFRFYPHRHGVAKMCLSE